MFFVSPYFYQDARRPLLDAPDSFTASIVGLFWAWMSMGEHCKTGGLLFRNFKFEVWQVFHDTHCGSASENYHRTTKLEISPIIITVCLSPSPILIDTNRESQEPTGYDVGYYYLPRPVWVESIEPSARPRNGLGEQGDNWNERRGLWDRWERWGERLEWLLPRAGSFHLSLFSGASFNRNK